MRKMMIGNVPYEYQILTYERPDGGICSIYVCWPENESDAETIYLVDNNGTNPFGHMSYATWVPTNEVKFK